MNHNKNRKVIRIFALASFLNDFGSDMIYPIWPMYVTHILGANMSILGLIDGLGQAVVSLSQAASGYMSDRFGKRKLFIWAGYLVASISRIGYAFSTTWFHLLLFKIVDRSGKIREAPRDAIISDFSNINNRGKNYGIVRAMDNLGAVFGITFCIVIFNIFGFHYIFLLAAIPSVLGALLIFLFISEPKSSRHERIRNYLSFKEIDKNLILFLIHGAFFALGSFSYSFILLYAKEFGFQTGFIPVLYLIFTLIAFGLSIPFGRLTDKLGRKPVLFLSYFFWILVCITFILFHTYISIIIAISFYGAHLGSLYPVQRSFVSELAPTQYRASVLGFFQMMNGLLALPASLIVGLLWDNIDKFIPLYFSVCFTIISIFILYFVKEQKEKLSEISGVH